MIMRPDNQWNRVVDHKKANPTKKTTKPIGHGHFLALSAGSRLGPTGETGWRFAVGSQLVLRRIYVVWRKRNKKRG